MSGQGSRQPLDDPTGDLRATMLARLEYGAMPWDDRESMAYREPSTRPRCARCGQEIQRGTALLDSPRGFVHERWCKPPVR